MVWPFKRKSTGDDAEVEETRKPSSSKFKQQKLPAWQPILTAYTVLPVFFFIGVVFVPVGIGLLVSSNNIKELVLDYSDHEDCLKCVGLANDAFNMSKPSNCTCQVKFELKSRWQGDVYFYYGLSNFYQNHRRYVRSRDDNQLHGTLSQSVNSNCEPFDKENGVAYAPCGAIANSMFTDTFNLTNTDINIEVPLTDEGITWKSDRETKFKNPDNSSVFSQYLKPKNWFRSNRDVFVNQDFIVWMRVAAFPKFRKFYRKLNRGDSQATQYAAGLPSGKYTLFIHYNYPVKSFDGKKRFILTTSSWIGGKNSFLGIAYIVVGCFCLIFGFVCLVIHMKVRTKPLMD